MREADRGCHRRSRRAAWTSPPWWRRAEAAERARLDAERVAAERDIERRQLVTVLEQAPLGIVITGGARPAASSSVNPLGSRAAVVKYEPLIGHPDALGMNPAATGVAR